MLNYFLWCNKRFFLFGGIVLNFLCSFSQVNNSMPVVYSFALQPFFHNPATNFKNRLELNANFHSYLGDFSDLNHTYVSFFYRLNPTEENSYVTNKRAIGGVFLNESTGDFIDRTRFYLSFQEQVLLDESLWLRFGAQAGALNYSIKSLGFSPGGSAWGFDASVALNLGSKNWSVSAIMHQFPNTEVTPILFTYVLDRYYELQANKVFKLSPNLNYSAHLRTQFNGEYALFMLSNSVEVNEKYGLNSTWNINKGVSFLGFYKMKKYQFFMDYFFPTNKALKNIDAMQFELGANFIFK